MNLQLLLFLILGQRGIFRTVSGLQVAYLSGRYDKNEYQKKHGDTKELVRKKRGRKTNLNVLFFLDSHLSSDRKISSHYVRLPTVMVSMVLISY